MRPLDYEVNSFEQIKALSNKLRVQILNLFSDGVERTNKQIALELGLIPTKVHYHVRELERVGLISVVKTNQIGGITEKYYLTVARNIRVPGDKQKEIMHFLSDEYFETYRKRSGEEDTLSHFYIFQLTEEEKKEFEEELKSVYKKWMTKSDEKDEKTENNWRFIQLLFKDK